MQSKSTLLFIIFGIAIGVALTSIWNSRQTERVVESDVLLEQIKQVTKVITVEGHFTELMTQNSYQGDFGFLWDKKAIVQVRAKVSAGYDLNHMELVLDPKAHTVRLKNAPKPEILSIDQQLAYYDISEGLFESFTASDYTQIQKDARRKIEEAATRSNLLQSAQAQGGTLMMALKSVVEQAGWRFETDFKL